LVTPFGEGSRDEEDKKKCGGGERNSKNELQTHLEAEQELNSDTGKG